MTGSMRRWKARPSAIAITAGSAMKPLCITTTTIMVRSITGMRSMGIVIITTGTMNITTMSMCAKVIMAKVMVATAIMGSTITGMDVMGSML